MITNWIGQPSRRRFPTVCNDPSIIDVGVWRDDVVTDRLDTELRLPKAVMNLHTKQDGVIALPAMID
jgi:hypothetical protein